MGKDFSDVFSTQGLDRTTVKNRTEELSARLPVNAAPLT